MKTIAIHSYRGGTGKTNIALSMAECLAQREKQVCLMDFDLRAPSLGSFFGYKPSNYINDFLEERCGIEDLLVSVEEFNDRLFVGFASSEIRDIKEAMKEDKKKQMKILSKILNGRDSLKDNMDYLIFDTTPGLRYSSTNVILSSDLVLLVATLDRSDLAGTKRMIEEIHEILDMPHSVIINKVPAGVSDEEVSKEVGDKLSQNMICTIQCYCEVMSLRGRETIFHHQPEHPFSRAIEEIADKIS
ncbi:MAG: CobQ/CobB/MinD/ParA nucleotide binding domain protein [Candidatus Methanolliviera sp. GoM_oil]|nr:MAG: CobQ/CobB/MinD/ParA nucleotide binding domain protein [Candidatus Methanolliviera sp. GoM_oil]